MSNLEKLLEYSRETQKARVNGQKRLFDGMKFNNNFQLLQAQPASQTEKLTWEKELLGLYVTSHPLENFKKLFETSYLGGALKILPISKINQFPKKNQKIRIGGIISSIKKILTRVGKPMLFINLEDLTDKIEVIVVPGIIERNPTIFQENKIVLVSGRIDSRDNVQKLICEEVEEILEET